MRGIAYFNRRLHADIGNALIKFSVYHGIGSIHAEFRQNTAAVYTLIGGGKIHLPTKMVAVDHLAGYGIIMPQQTVCGNDIPLGNVLSYIGRAYPYAVIGDIIDYDKLHAVFSAQHGQSLSSAGSSPAQSEIPAAYHSLGVHFFA